MIVRELIAKLGIDFDKSGAREADRALDKVKGKAEGLTKLNLGGLGAIVSGWAIKNYVQTALTAASDAEEGLGKLRAVFLGGAPEMERWSGQFADKMGRAKSEIVGFVSSAGGMIGPLQKNAAVTEEMSKKLAELAIDAAAFSNLDPADAHHRLMSGMRGETEAIEVLNVQLHGMRENAKAMGEKKDWLKMNMAERQMVIFKKIVKDMQQQIGHATKEAGTYAAAAKRAEASQTKLNEAVGRTIEREGKGYLRWLSGVTDWLRKMVESTNLVKSALIVLGGIAVGFGIRFAVANWPLLLFIATMVVLAGVVGEVIRIFQGKSSLIGHFFKELGDGIDMVMEKTKWLKDTVKALQDATTRAMEALGLLEADQAKRDAREEKALGLRPGTLSRARGDGSVDRQRLANSLNLDAVAPGIRAVETAIQAPPSASMRLPAGAGAAAGGGGGGSTTNVLNVIGDPDPSVVRRMRREFKAVVGGEHQRTIRAAPGVTGAK